MRFERVLAAAEAALLAFLLSFGGCSCLITAFSLSPVQPVVLALWCALGSVFFAVSSSVRYMNLPVLGAAALWAGFLWRRGTLALAVKAVIREISANYHSAYGWDILFWTERNLAWADMTPALIALGLILAFVAAWTVCRRITVIPAILLSALPLAACLVVTDRLPDGGCLYLLLLGQLILLLSQTGRHLSAARGNAQTAFVAIPTALALLLLFFALPRGEYAMPMGFERLFSRVDSWIQLSGDGPGFSSFDAADHMTIELSDVGFRMDTLQPVMDITSPVSGPVYLRGRAYDVYTGLGWENSGEDARQLYWPRSLSPQGTLTVSTRSTLSVVYTPYYTPDMGGLGISNGEDQTVFRFEYAVLPTDYTEAEVDGRLYGDVCTELPDATRRWAASLLPEILTNEDSIQRTAQDIADYVRDSATYSTWTRRIPDDREDFAQWFLTECDAGYCVHFATAAAVLLRAAGVPARYVTGYMINARANTPTVVRAENAHAWVEYWLPGVGWVVLESTPGMEQGGGTSTEPVTEPLPTEMPTEMPTESPTEMPTEAPTQATRPTQAAPTTPASTVAPSEGASGTPGGTDGSGTSDGGRHWNLAPLWMILKILLGCALVLGAVTGQWRLRLWLRRRKRARGPANAQAIAGWRYASRLARRLGEAPPKALFELAQKAKFSQHTLSQAELDVFDGYIDDALTRLRQKKPLRRLYDQLVLALY